MQALVFGGSGFIGSHVADALSDAGYEVTIADIRPSRYLRPDQKQVILNTLDREKVSEVIQGKDYVYNLAGIAHLDVGLSKPIETVEQNILATVIMLEAARKAAVKRFVYASSFYVYSEGGSFYRCSKQAAELYIEEFQRLHRLDYTILRYGSVYGPRADDHNSIRRYLKQAFHDRRIVANSTGDEVREYVHVKDAARLSVHILAEEFKNELVVLTGNASIRFMDILNMIREIVGSDVQIDCRRPDPNDPKYGNSGHFILTPYHFRPRIAKKLVSNPYLDLGQGLLDILERLHEEEVQRVQHVVVNHEGR